MGYNDTLGPHAARIQLSIGTGNTSTLQELIQNNLSNTDEVVWVKITAVATNNLLLSYKRGSATDTIAVGETFEIGGSDLPALAADDITPTGVSGSATVDLRIVQE